MNASGAETSVGDASTHDFGVIELAQPSSAAEWVQQLDGTPHMLACR